jgi:hypothetical protein
LSGTTFCHSDIVASYCNLQFHQSSSSAKLWCQLFQVSHHHINKTCILTLYSLYSNSSHFSQNNSIMARTKPQGKKMGASKAKTAAKQGQDNRRSSCQVLATSAAAIAAAPVAAPTTDAVVPTAGSLGTDAPSGISAPSAIAATTAVIASATSSTATADHSAAAAAPPSSKKGVSKARAPAEGIAAASGIAVPLVNAAASASDANMPDFTAATCSAAAAMPLYLTKSKVAFC